MRMKHALSAFVALSATALFAQQASAQALTPAGWTTINVVVDASQTLSASGCTASFPALVSGRTITASAAGVTLSGAFPCTAVTFASDFVVTASPSTDGGLSANIAVTGLSTSSAAGNCAQDSSLPAPAGRHFNNGTGYAGGTISGTTGIWPFVFSAPCNLTVTYTTSPAITGL